MPAKKLPKLLIFDGNALIHRSFHALPPTMKTSSGEVTNAVYGFTSFVLRAIKEFKPEMVAVAFDQKGGTFRHDAYKEYKAHRVKAPDELYAQIPRAREIAEALAIPVFQIAGCEADDVIGTIVKKVGGKAEKIIVTGDMDTLQLIDDHTKVYTMSRGFTDSIVYDEKQVQERYGLSPEQIIDYKALRGDPSDNIPGVRGIGEKTAITLLQEFKTVKNLYKNLKSKNIPDRIRELLETHKDDALMSYDLAIIKCDIDIDLNLDKVQLGGYDQQKVIALFNELEFKSLIPRLLQIETGGKKATSERQVKRTEEKFERNNTSLNYEIITDDKAFEKFYKKLALQKRISFDTETSGLDPFTSDLLGISVSWKSGEAYFLSIRQASLKAGKKTDLFNWGAKTESSLHPWLGKLKKILENPAVKKVGHNAKFDIKILKQFGIDVAGVDFDTMIAAYLLNPGSRQYSLDALALQYLDFEKISSAEMLGQGKSKFEFSTVSVERLGCYAAEDADITFRLFKILEKKLKEQDLEKLFKTIEMPLTDCLIDMELTGIALDGGFFEKLDKELDQEIQKTQKAIWKASDSNFNIASPKQLQDILFTKLNISSAGLGRTKTGISTGADELLKLKGKHKVIDLILTYRELTKLSSTYVKTLPLLVNPVTKRIHTTFNQTIAATGRLSSVDPNLQNIPIRTELGRRVRHGFIAKTGYELLSLDYSQIELRLAAHLSGDPAMIKAFKKNEDIHTATAAAINHVSLEKVTKEMRRAAKATNFGILYGQGPHGLSQTADIPYEEARQFIDEYFTAYGSVKAYIEATLQYARKHGCVETLFGRKRFLEEINANNAMVKKAAERMAVNTPIQGSAADMIKVAMISVHDLIAKKYPHTVSLLLQVHDELLFEVKRGLVEEIAPQLKRIMEQVIKLSVPIIVDAKHGANWETMKPLNL